VRTFLLLACSAAFSVGCGKPEPSKVQVSPSGSKPGVSDDVAVERAKLSAEGRAAVEAQEWCAISTDQRLGSMGPPLKLDITGQTVFLCCKGCQRKAEADPEKTLASVEILKAKAKASKDTKQ
jgi:hypothetical protein